MAGRSTASPPPRTPWEAMPRSAPAHGLVAGGGRSCPLPAGSWREPSAPTPSGPGRDRSRGNQRRRPNRRSVTFAENRMASPPPGPAPGSPRTLGKVPARTPRWWPAASPLPACGTTGEYRGVRVTSRRNASSTGAPPGGGRCSRLPADRGDGAGTGRSGGAGREATAAAIERSPRPAPARNTHSAG